jgi:hypothetical protein
MLNSINIWLSVLAVLIAYLCVSIGLRRRAAEARRRASERVVSGSALDVSAIAPRIQQLRQNHFAVAHSRIRSVSHRKELIASAVEAVRNFSYFRRARLNQELPRSDTHGPMHCLL